MLYFELMCPIYLAFSEHTTASVIWMEIQIDGKILLRVFQGLQFCLQSADRAINFRHSLVCLTEYRPSDLSNECKICLSA